MQAGRTFLERFGPEMDISAFPAIPEYFFITLEDLILHYILKEFPVSFLVSLFSSSDGFECSGYFLETFFFRDIGECRVKIVPFFMFAFSCSKKVCLVVSILPAGYEAVISTIPPSRNLKTF